MAASTSLPEMGTSENQSAASVAATFDELGIRYEKAFGNVPAIVKNINSVIAQLPAGARVLDLGSGTGKPTAALFADAGHDVTGIDISPEMVAVAAQQVPRGRFEVADLRTWEPASGAGSFDAVVACLSLIIGMSQRDIRETFRRVHQWLRPGGYFLFVTVSMDREFASYKWLGRPIVSSGLAEDDSIAELEKIGFEIVHKEAAGYTPRGGEAGICDQSVVYEEPHTIMCARKLA